MAHHGWRRESQLLFSHTGRIPVFNIHIDTVIKDTAAVGRWKLLKWCELKET